MEFKFKGYLYDLIFEDKPVLKEDGNEIKGKILSILKDYIATNNIEISIFDGKGNPKNTHTLANDFLRFHEPKFKRAVKANKKKPNTQNDKKMKQDKSLSSQNADLLVAEKIMSIPFERMSREKKLLIIACSVTKNPGGNVANYKNFFESGNDTRIFNDIIVEREVRVNQYRNVLKNNISYFLNYGGVDIQSSNLNGQEYLPAIERYSGRFYNQELKELYFDKNSNSNLHILIVSGLYGILEFTDSILNYHLEINKANAIWNSKNNFTLQEVTKKYIEINKIENENVFYAVSPSGYEDALKPLESWKSLWVSGARSAYSIKCVEEFLKQLK